MPVFYLILPVIAAALGLIVLARAAGAARRAASDKGDNAEMALWRRRLAEIDDQAGKGLMTPEAAEAERNEAARRLIRAADETRPTEGAGGPRSRLAVLAGFSLSAVIAFGLYMVIGHPTFGDQPYAARLASWTRADPRQLSPAQMAAILRNIVRGKPGDVQALAYLGQAEMAAGQPGEAVSAYGRAARLAPNNPDLQIAYGEALMTLSEGKITPDARRAFQAAHDAAPGADAPRYYLARARIEAGDVAGGLADWRAMAAALPPDDAHRALIQRQIAEVEKTGGLATGEGEAEAAAQGPPAAAMAAGADQSAFIHAMVDRLAKRLETSPDDPEGWARLVRAQGVLKDKAAQDAALAKARKLFAGRPDVLSRIEAQAKAVPAS